VVLGFGTERIEEELAHAFPDVGILRMDADTTASRGSHERILDAFRDTNARILVGTQLVAKGHDFPEVTLAAVVGVDHLLLSPTSDRRSARTRS
jgi:primosomal protein N' (replication factor Y)